MNPPVLYERQALRTSREWGETKVGTLVVATTGVIYDMSIRSLRLWRQWCYSCRAAKPSKG